MIRIVRPLYQNEKVPDLEYFKAAEIYAIDSTTISCSIKLMTWALGKYSKGAVKMHTILSLKGSIPDMIVITDGKYHDSNFLDEFEPQPNAFYVMDKALYKNPYTVTECATIIRVSAFERTDLATLLTKKQPETLLQNQNVNELTLFDKF